MTALKKLAKHISDKGLVSKISEILKLIIRNKKTTRFKRRWAKDHRETPHQRKYRWQSIAYENMLYIIGYQGKCKLK